MPVFGLVAELSDGVELPASIADNSTGTELLELISRFAATNWEYTHLAIPNPGTEIQQLMSSGVVIDGQLRIKVNSFAQAFELQVSLGNLHNQENHARYEDTLDREKYLWGRNREAVDHRANTNRVAA